MLNNFCRPKLPNFTSSNTNFELTLSMLKRNRYAPIPDNYYFIYSLRMPIAIVEFEESKPYRLYNLKGQFVDMFRMELIDSN